MFGKTAKDMFEKRSNPNLTGFRYKHDGMEEAVKDIIERKTGSRSTMLRGNDKDAGCKV